MRRVLSGDGLPSATLADVFVFDDEQRRLLLLFGEVAVAAAGFVAGTALSGLTTDCRVDPTGVTGLLELLMCRFSFDRPLWPGGLPPWLVSTGHVGRPPWRIYKERRDVVGSRLVSESEMELVKKIHCLCLIVCSLL